METICIGIISQVSGSLFPKKDGKINYLVNGVMTEEYYYCSTSRDNNNMCDEEGKYYKKKIVKNLKF